MKLQLKNILKIYASIVFIAKNRRGCIDRDEKVII